MRLSMELSGLVQSVLELTDGVGDAAAALSN